MFIRLVADSFSRRLSRKLVTAGALALGMAVAGAALSVSLDVGDRLAREFRSLGANLVVVPTADSIPLQIGDVDYRPVNAGALLPQADLGKLKTIFWRNNIAGFAPLLEVPVEVQFPSALAPTAAAQATLIGTWVEHSLTLPDGQKIVTGVAKTNPWWQVRGRWFSSDQPECVLGEKFARRTNFAEGSELVLVAAGQSLRLRVTGILTTGGPEEDAVVAPLALAQQLAGKPGQYRRLYISALTMPEDDFSRRNPDSFTPAEYDRWFCTPYVSSIALQVRQALPGADVRVIRRVAEGEGRILTRVRTLLWLVAGAALLAASLVVGATSAATIVERRAEIALMKALGAGAGLVKSLFAAEQILLALAGGAVGFALGLLLTRILSQFIFGAAPRPSLFVFAIVLSLAVLVTMLGSAASLRRAARIHPAPVLRGE